MYFERAPRNDQKIHFHETYQLQLSQYIIQIV